MAETWDAALAVVERRARQGCQSSSALNEVLVALDALRAENERLRKPDLRMMYGYELGIEDGKAERDALAAKVAAVEALHSPFRIYDECEHEHTEEDVAAGRAVEVPEIGYTCEAALLYVACRECCTSNDGLLDWQTEECATYHDHRDGFRCHTRAALDAPEGEQTDG